MLIKGVGLFLMAAAATADVPPATPPAPIAAAPPLAPKVVLQNDHQIGAEIAAWTPDGRFLLTAAAEDNSFIIWDVQKAIIVDHLRLPAPNRDDGDTIDGFVSLTVSPENRSARLIVKANAAESAKFDYPQTFTLDLTTRTWTVGKAGSVSATIREADGKAAFPDSPDGKLSISRAGAGILLVPYGTTRAAPVATLIGDTSDVNTSLAISPDGNRLALLTWINEPEDTAIDIFDLATGHFLSRAVFKGQYWVVRWIGNDRYLVSESPDFYVPAPTAEAADDSVLPAVLAAADSGRTLARYAPRCGVGPVGPSGMMLGVGLGRCSRTGKDGGLWLADASATPVWRAFAVPSLSGRMIQAVAAAPDGKSIAIVSKPAGAPKMALQRIEVIDAASGAQTSQMIVHASVGADGLRWSTDGAHILLTGDSLQAWQPGAAKPELDLAFDMPDLAATDGKTILLGSIMLNSLLVQSLTDPKDVLTQKDIQVIAGGFLAGKGVYWTASEGGGVRFYDQRTNKKLLTLFTFEGRKYFALDPRGRYDTNLGADSSKMRWLVSDDPWRSLAPQTFIRDYFEPGLIARTLACTAAGDCTGKFRDPPPVTLLDRILPTVTIDEIRAGSTPGTAEVEITVRQTHDPAATNGNVDSGAYDLRLFRDGRLVVESPDVATTATADMDHWRAATRVIAPGDGEPAHLRVTVPVPSGPAAVAFSAYAFNQDRVKGETAKGDYAPDPPIARPHRAYVIAIGINAYDERQWQLHFAAGDAVAVSQALARIDGYEVVPVRLVADGASHVADRDQIQALFRLLAGDEGARAGLLAAGVDVSGVRKATPDDAVLISFAGHGYTDPGGDFYLVPQDARKGADGLPDLATLVSSGALTDWLRPVDAGEMELVIDACHSAASVQTRDFKPAPLGDPGLGQLAFDKGIRILAATQGDDVAVESVTLQHGLLTYVLTELGLAQGEADLDHDRKITLTELLTFTAARLPEVAATMKPHAIGDVSRTLIFDTPAMAPPPHVQQPSLFDFTEAPSKLVLRDLMAGGAPAK